MKNCIFILLLFLSCNKKQIILDKLTNNDYKFWHENKIDNSKSNSEYFYYFDIKGNWYVFIKYANGSFEKYDGGDVVLINKWKLIDNVLIEIGGKQYKIEKIDNDEFIYSSENNSFRKTLEAANDSLIPTQYLHIIYNSRNSSNGGFSVQDTSR